MKNTTRIFVAVWYVLCRGGGGGVSGSGDGGVEEGCKEGWGLSYFFEKSVDGGDVAE